MRARPELAAASAGAVVLTGVQGIVPALPDLQRDLQLSDTGVSIMMLGYLLAAMISAFPAGVLADRFGNRAVMVTSLLVFAAAGVAAIAYANPTVFLGLRLVQGAGFGAALSLSVTVLAALISPARQAQAQSRRVVAMSATEAVLPLIAGFLVVGYGWRAAFLLALLAVPVAILCWFALPRDSHGGETARGGTTAPAFAAVFSWPGLAIQLPGFVRFFLKFAGLTYFPLFADRSVGLDAAGIGVVISAASLMGIVAAALIPMTIRRFGFGVIFVSSVILAAAPFAMLPVATTVFIFTALVILAGVGDSALGVMNHVIIARAAPADARGAFIGITSTFVNAGKVAAPALVGAIASIMTIGGALAVVGIAGLSALLSTRRALHVVRDPNAGESIAGR